MKVCLAYYKEEKIVTPHSLSLFHLFFLPIKFLYTDILKKVNSNER